MGGRGRGRGGERGRGRGRDQQQRNESQEYPPIAQLRIGDRPVQVGGMGPPQPSFTQAAAPPPQRAHQPPTPRASSQPPMPTEPPPSQTPTPEGTSSVLAKCQFPARNGKGSCGRKMKVESNHFRIRVQNGTLLIIIYDVDMKLISERDGSLKECHKKYFKRGILAFGHEVWPGRYPAYDGSKLLFSCQPKLINGQETRDVNVRNDDRFNVNGEAETAKLRITVKEVQTVRLTEIGQFFNNKNTAQFPHLAIQAIDVILRNSGMTSLLQVGRSFYHLPHNPIDLGDGFDLWHGVFQSATIGDNMLLLNVDVAHKGFPREQSVRDLVADLGTNKWNRRQRYNPEREYQYGSRHSGKIDGQLRNYLKGLKIEYEIPQLANSKRVYRVNDVVQAPSRQRFYLDTPNGQKRQVTVAEYYKTEKRYEIRHPHWPCLHVGSKDRNIFVPMELCKVMPKQVSIKKLNEVQTSNMVRAATTKPKDRKKKIMEAFDSLNLMSDLCLREFDIKVEPQMTQVEGRVLIPPALKYRADYPVRVRDGAWRMDRQQFKTVAKEVQKWAILDLSIAKEASIRYLRDKLVSVGASVGMTFNANPKILLSAELRDAYELSKFLQSQVREGPFDLLVVIIPDSIGGKDPHAVVKHVLEMKNKIITQCIELKTLMKVESEDRNSQSIVPNILLKINTKLDGKTHAIHENSRPPCFNDNVMIMGADVTHPPPDSKSVPSVAAVTASHDKEDVFKFSMQWRLQPPGIEIILDMEDVVLKHLKFFAAKNGGTYPSRIIYYRDGVGDSQFEAVLRAELSAIRRAAMKIGLTYMPRITFLVVQKRHHTRFFPKEGDSMADRNGNVPAGFVVDNTITHPRDMDFYLVSHQSIQGTSRPTKYKMLYDDANMNEDEVEQLTFNLCHLYARCNRSVSYPAPTYYAHHAATRAKEYYMEAKLTIDVKDEKALKDESVKLNDLMSSFTKDHPMFFM
ncbi:protein argonaute-2-like [Cloeon dipterum]|uniref:protein argonaute-2-like n=1 Tax=Cloeon dipterum TaxID=197152 RepID=UPI00321FCD8B